MVQHHLVIDFNNHCFRATMRDAHLMNEKGESTGIVFLCLNMLKELANRFEPSSITFVEDGGLNKERMKFYPEYKSERIQSKLNRTQIERDQHVDFVRQKNLFKEFFEPLNIKHLQFDSNEADDVIAYISHLVQYVPPFTFAGNMKHKVIIVSTDKDFRHLVCENVELFSPIRHILLNKSSIPNSFYELFSKSVLGDEGDGIGNIPGVGEGTVEEAFENFKDIKEEDVDKFFEVCASNKNGRVRKIFQYKDIVIRNMKIISLRYKDGFVRFLDPEIKEQVKEIFFRRVERPVNKDKLLELCYNQNFKSVYKNLHLYFRWADSLLY